MLWNLILVNPHETFAQGKFVNVSNQKSVGQKVKGAAKHIERFRSNVEKYQLTDRHTFANWWKFYAKGQKPVPYLELQRQNSGNKRSVDHMSRRVKHPVKVYKIPEELSQADSKRIRVAERPKIVRYYQEPSKQKPMLGYITKKLDDLLYKNPNEIHSNKLLELVNEMPETSSDERLEKMLLKKSTEKLSEHSSASSIKSLLRKNR